MAATPNQKKLLWNYFVKGRLIWPVDTSLNDEDYYASLIEKCKVVRDEVFHEDYTILLEAIEENKRYWKNIDKKKYNKFYKMGLHPEEVPEIEKTHGFVYYYKLKKGV